MSATPLTAARAALDHGLRAIVAELRGLQDATGAVVRDAPRAATLLGRLPTEVARVCAVTKQEALATAFAEDTAGWLARGLDAPPDFSRVRAAYEAPEDGALSFFAGPALAQNGPAPRGMFVEYFLTQREEPRVVRDLVERLPHPVAVCQSTRLVEASVGFGTGNCIVFFPEYVAAKSAIHAQSYAVFFFNKFHRIFLSETMPIVRRLIGDRDSLFGGDAWVSTLLSPREFYEARCVWGYLHDYFHHQGPRPLHHHLQLKTRSRHCSLLEELRADARTGLFLLDEQTPYWREVVEFMLFERLFRYPTQPDRDVNFDSGTGFFLFEWFLARGAIQGTSAGLHLSREGTTHALRELVRTIESNEAEADDAAYVRASERFVHDLIPRGEGDAEFAIPGSYLALAPLPHASAPLDMSALPY